MACASSNAPTNTDNAPEKPADDKEVIDIDLKDPEVEKAAKAIQAKFKGIRRPKKPATEVRKAEEEKKEERG